MATRQNKEPAVKARGFVFSTLSFFVICAALVFGMSVFFRVSEIQVEGAGRYSVQEIQEASGVAPGDNLMMINRETIEKRLRSQLLYLGGVRIERKLPNVLLITVAESGAVGLVGTDEGAWLVDATARLLEPCPPGDEEKYLRISGLAAVKPKPGEAMRVADEDKPKLALLQALLPALAESEVRPALSGVDVSNPVNAEAAYQSGRFRVRLGAKDDMDYKLELLREVLEKLEPEDSGVIDLSQDKRAQFFPFAE